MAETSPTTFAIDLEDVSLAFEGEPLFQRLSFRLEPGLCTCLLGPSGVGKSSLLRLIAGLLSPDTGRIRCSDGLPADGRLAWMGQGDGLFPWLSVGQNVLLGSRLRGEPPNRARAMALLGEVGLGAMADRLPATLSGGQRQRAALVRTLVEDRPVVLMDEPFSSLDAITRTRLQELAARSFRDRTVLLVTHDPLEALRLGDRIHVMAGSPAAIEPALSPGSAPPRALDDRDLLDLQATLLGRLAGAADQAA